MNSTLTLKIAAAISALLVSMLCGHELFAREGPVTAVQNALVRAQFLAGEPSGVLDESTHAALRQYQSRHGLPVTGEIDSATLQELQGSLADQIQDSARPPLPDSVVASDREFLRTLAAAKNADPASSAAPAKAVEPHQGAVPTVQSPGPIVTTARHETTGRDEPKADPTPAQPKTRTHAAATASTASNEMPSSQRHPDTDSNTPAPATRSQTAPAVTPANEEDSDLRPATRVIVTRSKGLDGRITITERRITSYDATQPRPEVEESVRSNDNRFFHRLFHHD